MVKLPRVTDALLCVFDAGLFFFARSELANEGGLTTRTSLILTLLHIELEFALVPLPLLLPFAVLLVLLGTVASIF